MDQVRHVSSFGDLAQRRHACSGRTYRLTYAAFDADAYAVLSMMKVDQTFGDRSVVGRPKIVAHLVA